MVMRASFRRWFAVIVVGVAATVVGVTRSTSDGEQVVTGQSATPDGSIGVDELYEILQEDAVQFMESLIEEGEATLTTTIVSPIARDGASGPYETVGGIVIVAVEPAVTGTIELPYFREGDPQSEHCEVILGSTVYELRSVRYFNVTGFLDESRNIQVRGVDPITAESAEDDFPPTAERAIELDQPGIQDPTGDPDRVEEVRELGSAVTDFAERPESWEDDACESPIPARGEGDYD